VVAVAEIGVNARN